MSLLTTILICIIGLLVCLLTWAFAYVKYLSDQLDSYTGALDPVYLVDTRVQED